MDKDSKMLLILTAMGVSALLTLKAEGVNDPQKKLALLGNSEQIVALLEHMMGGKI